MTCEFLLRREDDRAASDEPNGTDEEATPELERDEAAPPWVPDELTLLERCELDEAGMGTGSGMLDYRLRWRRRDWDRPRLDHLQVRWHLHRARRRPGSGHVDACWS